MRIVQASIGMCEKLNGTGQRIVDAMQDRRSQKLGVRDRRFIFGTAAEGSSEAFGYAVACGVHDRTKEDVGNDMLTIAGFKDFYSEHALVVLTRYGFATRAGHMGMKDIHETVCAGSRSVPYLDLLASAVLGAALGSMLTHQGAMRYLLVKREKHARVAWKLYK